MVAHQKNKKSIPSSVDREAKHALKEVESFRSDFVRELPVMNKNIQKGNTAAVRLFYKAKAAATSLQKFVKRRPAFSILLLVVLALGTNSHARRIALERLRLVPLPNKMTAEEFVNAYWPWAKSVVPEATVVPEQAPAAAAVAAATAFAPAAAAHVATATAAFSSPPPVSNRSNVKVSNAAKTPFATLPIAQPPKAKVVTTVKTAAAAQPTAWNTMKLFFQRKSRVGKKIAKNLGNGVGSAAQYVRNGAGKLIEEDRKYSKNRSANMKAWQLAQDQMLERNKKILAVGGSVAWVPTKWTMGQLWKLGSFAWDDIVCSVGDFKKYNWYLEHNSVSAHELEKDPGYLWYATKCAPLRNERRKRVSVASTALAALPAWAIATGRLGLGV
jgi:hypothetical protein